LLRGRQEISSMKFLSSSIFFDKTKFGNGPPGQVKKTARPATRVGARRRLGLGLHETFIRTSRDRHTLRAWYRHDDRATGDQHLVRAGSRDGPSRPFAGVVFGVASGRLRSARNARAIAKAGGGRRAASRAVRASQRRRPSGTVGYGASDSAPRPNGAPARRFAGAARLALEPCAPYRAHVSAPGLGCKTRDVSYRRYAGARACGIADIR